ncbi:transposase [Streptomyces inhibens]|uniref:transposase n=1 Tax=Streptomyces inhibens TaxID=2293571 RepID=UPI0036C2C778
MLDAVLHVADNGVKWANLPADFPPYRRVHPFARRWQVTGGSPNSTTGCVASGGTSTAPPRPARPAWWTPEAGGGRRTSPPGQRGGTAGRKRAAASGTSWWTASVWSWPCS